MKKIINSSHAPNPVGPYNHAVAAAGLLFVSGMVGINPATGVLISKDIESETGQAMDNLQNVLKAADLTMNDVVKCTIYVTNMGLYARINEVYATYFPGDTAPARELVEVCALPVRANFEISAIAKLP